MCGAPARHERLAGGLGDIVPIANRPTTRVSRPVELHHRLLAEPSVKLSPHSAPIRQTCQSYLNGLPVARIEVLLLPVASVV